MTEDAITDTGQIKMTIDDEGELGIRDSGCGMIRLLLLIIKPEVRICRIRLFAVVTGHVLPCGKLVRQLPPPRCRTGFFRARAKHRTDASLPNQYE